MIFRKNMPYPNPQRCAQHGVKYNCDICAFKKKCPILKMEPIRIKYKLAHFLIAGWVLFMAWLIWRFS